MSRYQEGSLVKKCGGYHVRYYVTESGVRKQKSHRLCDDQQPKGRAKQFRDEYMRQHVNIGADNNGAMSVVDFWDREYLPFIEKNNNVKPSTLHGYRQVWHQHLKTHFAALTLTEYKTHMMTTFLTGLASQFRPRTLDHIKWLGSAIFAHAVATGRCETNPIRDARVLGKTKGNGTTKAYSLEEIEDVISALVEDVRAQLVMSLSWFAGLRKGEIQGLQWNDIDNKFIHVRRAFSRGLVGEPKSKKSMRAIPIIQPVREPLLLWKAKAGKGEWVFTNSEGKAMDMDFFARRFIKPVLEENKIEWKGFHAGRRGLGSELRSITGNSNAGRDALGHSTTRVTEEHYEKSLPQDLLAGMKLLEAKIVER